MANRRSMITKFSVGALLLVSLAVLTVVIFQQRRNLEVTDLSPPPISANPRAQVVAATVDGEPITIGDMQRKLSTSGKNSAYNVSSAIFLEASILEQLINERLTFKRLRQLDSQGIEKTMPAAELVNRTMQAEISRVQSQGKDFQTVLDNFAMTEEDYRRQTIWNLAWQQYCKQHLTDKLLEETFRQNRQHLDGTRIAVSHILLRPKDRSDIRQLTKLVQQAEAIRQEILAGKISFAEAARKFSSGPSSLQGGSLGFIPRQGALDESFSQAAFRLKPEELSNPVQSSIGIHLIRCDTIEPGQKTWQDVREELSTLVQKQMIQQLAGEIRNESSIRYTGETSYRDPVTRKIVLAGKKGKK